MGTDSRRRPARNEHDLFDDAEDDTASSDDEDAVYIRETSDGGTESFGAGDPFDDDPIDADDERDGREQTEAMRSPPLPISRARGEKKIGKAAGAMPQKMARAFGIIARYLNEHGRPPFLAEVNRELSEPVDHQGPIVLLRAMRDRGLLTYDSKPGSNRFATLRLTEAGVDLAGYQLDSVPASPPSPPALPTGKTRKVEVAPPRSDMTDRDRKALPKASAAASTETSGSGPARKRGLAASPRPRTRTIVKMTADMRRRILECDLLLEYLRAIESILRTQPVESIRKALWDESIRYAASMLPLGDFR